MENFRHSLDKAPEGFIYRRTNSRRPVPTKKEYYSFTTINKAIALQSDLEGLDLAKRNSPSFTETIHALSKLYGGRLFMPTGVVQSVRDDFN